MTVDLLKGLAAKIFNHIDHPCGQVVTGCPDSNVVGGFTAVVAFGLSTEFPLAQLFVRSFVRIDNDARRLCIYIRSRQF